MRGLRGLFGDRRNAIQIVSDRARLQIRSSVKLPDRPNSGLVVGSAERVDFDKSLLPKDSWEIELNADEYESEEISDVRSEYHTCYNRIHKYDMVRWNEYRGPTSIEEYDLNCGALL